MWEYLKTVDFMNTKIIMFKINSFYPIEYRQNTKLHDIEIEGQGHFKFMTL